MLGLFRLLLAALVAAFHAGFRPYGLRVGVSAVVAFFIISGYAMSGLAARRFSGRRGDIWRFYRDRVLRLYPLYAVWLVVTALIVYGLGRQWIQQGGPPDWINVVGNITIFPLTFYMFLPSVFVLMLLPQAWSLSLELWFYVVFPAVQRSRVAGWMAAAGGFVVFAAATSGAINPEWYAFRLLPGVLPFFMVGRAWYRRDWPMLVLLTAAMAADAAWVSSAGLMGLGVNAEVFLGGAIGFAGLAAVTAVRPWRWDGAFGGASYGCYLAHVPLLSLMGQSVTSVPARAILITSGAVALGGLSHWAVERPVDRFRRRIRRVGHEMSPRVTNNSG